MTAFHSVLPGIAERELRRTRVQAGTTPESGLSAGEYGFVEFYCEDLGCDCRRVFIQVIRFDGSREVLASINYGWEDESFYRRKMPFDPEAPGEIVAGSLDPLNTQSAQAKKLLELFREQVRDEGYRLLLQRHHELFREEIRRRQQAAERKAPRAASRPNAGRPQRSSGGPGVPAAHRERFEEVAALLIPFGEKHLDPELAGFCLTLWTRICRLRMPVCLGGKPQVWAASVVHVIARMNFLFDRSQPVHLTFDTICGFFQTNKTTVGGKATEIRRKLRLRNHSEPGLCRIDIMESFTMVRFSNGMVLPWKVAKQMGLIPQEARVEDL